MRTNPICSDQMLDCSLPAGGTLTHLSLLLLFLHGCSFITPPPSPPTDTPTLPLHSSGLKLNIKKVWCILQHKKEEERTKTQACFLLLFFSQDSATVMMYAACSSTLGGNQLSKPPVIDNTGGGSDGILTWKSIAAGMHINLHKHTHRSGPNLLVS